MPTENWSELEPIFHNFTFELQQDWENDNFSQQEVKEWLILGLREYEMGFATYLKSNGYGPHSHFTEGMLEQLRKFYLNIDFTKLLNGPFSTQSDSIINEFPVTISEPVTKLANKESVKKAWKDIHPGFSKENYQQLWGEIGLTYQKAQEWIKVGFEPGDYRWIRKAKKEGYDSQTFLQLLSSPQQWLEVFYPLKKRIEYERLYDLPFQLTGKLVISEWKHLNSISYELLDKRILGDYPLQLTITDCPQLNYISLNGIYLTKLNITSCHQLESIYVDDFQLTNETLTITNCPKLEKLDIGNTNICDLECLPESLEKLYCDDKCKLVEQLEGYENLDEDRYNFYNYQAWRKYYNSQQQIKILQEENVKVNSLENEITRLTNLIKEQKEKIIKAYTHFFQEKELLQQLITAHLEYQKAKEGKIKLKKHKEKLWEELAEKVSEELMEKVEFILEDCQQLIHYEKELQYQITNNQKLVASHEKTVQQITYNITNLNLTNQGPAFVGNTQTGNNTDLSLNLREVLETKIELPEKKRLRKDSWEERENSKKTRNEELLQIIELDKQKLQGQIEIPPKNA